MDVAHNATPHCPIVRFLKREKLGDLFERFKRAWLFGNNK